MVECKPLNEVCREGKKVFERPSRKWEDNTIKVLRQLCCEDVYKIRLALNRDQLTRDTHLMQQFIYYYK